MEKDDVIAKEDKEFGAEGREMILVDVRALMRNATNLFGKK